jgi:hypothetical protein
MSPVFNQPSSMAVLAQDARTADQQLAVGSKLQVDAGEGFADAPVAVTGRCVGGRPGGRLGHAPAVVDGDSESPEELLHLFREWGSAADEQAQPPAADAEPDRLEDRVAERAQPPGEGEVEEEPLPGRLLADGVADPVDDLLEHPRHPEHQGGVDGGDVLGQVLEAAGDPDLGAGGDRDHHSRLPFEDVREGQEGEQAVLRPDAEVLERGASHPDEVGVGEDDALGVAGGPRGVDDGGDVRRLERGEAPLPLRPGRPRRVGGQPARQLAVHLDHLHALGEVRGQPGIAHDREPGPAVGDDLGRRLRGGGRIDRDGYRGGGLDAEVGQDPLDPVLGEEDDRLPRLDALLDQGSPDPEHAGPALLPAQRLPGGAVPAMEEGGRAPPLRLLQEDADYRLSQRAPTLVA